MNRRHCSLIPALVVSVAAFVAASPAHAQTGYGVNAAGTLFKFDVNAPSVVTTIGSIGFVPEGIDFRPGTRSLYAIDIGPNTSQVYTLDITTAVATPVGAGFTSTGSVNNVAYSLTDNDTFGFDFNPKTLQDDDSMRIRLVGTSGVNLRLNSSTGQIAAVDGSILFGNGNSAFVDAVAYINNIPQKGGTTALYDLDSRNDALLLQNPPNNGTVTTVGPLGVSIDAQRNIGFDIYTAPGDADLTIGGDFGYAVFTRPDAPISNPGIYLLYDVNLGTGQATGGAVVGSIDSPFDFEGGFAVVPEPGSIILVSVAAVGLGLRYRRRVAQ